MQRSEMQGGTGMIEQSSKSCVASEAPRRGIAGVICPGPGLRKNPNCIYVGLSREEAIWNRALFFGLIFQEPYLCRDLFQMRPDTSPLGTET